VGGENCSNTVFDERIKIGATNRPGWEQRWNSIDRFASGYCAPSHGSAYAYRELRLPSLHLRSSYSAFVAPFPQLPQPSLYILKLRRRVMGTKSARERLDDINRLEAQQAFALHLRRHFVPVTSPSEEFDDLIRRLEQAEKYMRRKNRRVHFARTSCFAEE
jgi:hypothetical protein